MSTTPMTLATAHADGAAIAARHCARWCAFVRSLSSEQLQAPVPGSVWSAAEVVTHVRTVLERYAGERGRGQSPEALEALNRADVERVGVDVDAALQVVESQVALLVSATDHIDPEQRFPFHSGQEVTFAAGWGNLLGEFLVHGDDIARATGTRYTVPGTDLEILWRFTGPALAGWLRPDTRDLDESWDLHFPFGRLRVCLQGGTLHWDCTERRARHHEIPVEDTVTLTLQFPYRRRAITDPKLALLASRFYDL